MTMSMREIAREAEHLHRIIDETQLDDAMMSDEDRAAMAIDGVITVDCAFCSRNFPVALEAVAGEGAAE